MSRGLLLFLSLLLGPAAQGPDEPPPPEVKAAMEELWRRGRCLLSSVHKPAARESAVPEDIGHTQVLDPRLYARRAALLCYALHGQTIWAADDQSLYQVDGKAGKLIRRFGPPNGLPNVPIQAIAPAGDALWLATRSGLARVDPKTGRIAPLPDIRFKLARLAAGPSGLWLVSDAGAYRLAPGQSRWRRLPDFPGQEQLAKITRRGFWSALWRNRRLATIPSMFATDDGLYVVCLKRLLRYHPAGNEWLQISDQAWQAIPQARAVWALTTSGAVRYDPAAGRTEQFQSGQGPAAGRPITAAATDRAFFMASQPDYDDKAKRFVGGGISRLDLTTGTWTITETVDGADIRFVSALLADGDQVWAACTLYDRAVELGAHPGMAHVKRWRPHPSGLGLLRCSGGRYTLIKGERLETEKRWVMGQKDTVKPDCVGPESIESLCRCGTRAWGVYRMVPEQYYAGYYISAGCLAVRSEDEWQKRFDTRTSELDLGGEQPELMLISHSHGDRIVLAEGHPVVLGIEQVAGRAWAVCESGLFVHDPQSDRFTPVVQEEFRLYWRATAAAAGKGEVWFGGDGGTISRLDRDSGCLELVGVVPGRKIVAIRVEQNRVAVRTAKTTVTLPVSLRSAPRLPEADSLVFDGKTWSAASARVEPAGSSLSCREKSSYLYRGDRQIAFLKGVFRPTVLCEDSSGNKLWLATYHGVASIPLPADEKN